MRILNLAQAIAAVAMSLGQMQQLNPKLTYAEAEHNTRKAFGSTAPNKLSQKGKRKRARQQGSTVRAMYR